MPRAQQVEALWNGLRDNSGEPLAGGKVFSYAAGTNSNKDLYTASDKSSSATNPLILDAYGRAQVWADGAYKFVVKTSTDTTLYTLDNQVYGYDDGELLWGGTSGGTANAQTLSGIGTISAYAAGQRFIFIAGNSNSGACTLNVNSIGAVSIVKGPAAGSLSSGDIRAGQVVDVVYDSGGGGRFRLMNYPSLNDVQNSALIWGGTSTGSANVQAIAVAPAITAYAAGQVFFFNPGFTNSSSLTLNVNGLGAKAVQRWGAALVGGEVKTNAPCLVVYDGTQFQLLSYGTMEPLFIDTTNARVGVGTTAPTKRMDIVYTNSAGGSAERQVRVENTSTFNSVGISLVGSRSWDVYVSGSGSVPAGAFAIHDATGAADRLRIDSSGYSYLVGSKDRTTGLSANCHIDSTDGGIYRSTSSRRYKKDIETLEASRAEAFVDAARPVWYRSRSKHDNPAWGFYGFIAEEIAEIEPALVYWNYPDSDFEEVEVDDVDQEGKPIKVRKRKLKETAERIPESVMYERVAPMLVSVIKGLKSKVSNLESRIAALESK